MNPKKRATLDRPVFGAPPEWRQTEMPGLEAPELILKAQVVPESRFDPDAEPPPRLFEWKPTPPAFGSGPMHTGPRKPRRRNLGDVRLRTDPRTGLVYPIRGSEDYSDAFLKLRARQREREGISAIEQQLERRYPDIGKLTQADRRLQRLQVERDTLKEALASDPVAPLTALVRQKGEWRGQLDLIPFEQARPLIKKLTGRSPEAFRQGIQTDRFGRKYLEYDDVLDTVADNLGYESVHDLKDAVDRLWQEGLRLAELENELKRLRRDARAANPAQRPRWLGAVLLLGGLGALTYWLTRRTAAAGQGYSMIGTYDLIRSQMLSYAFTLQGEDRQLWYHEYDRWETPTSRAVWLDAIKQATRFDDALAQQLVDWWMNVRVTQQRSPTRDEVEGAIWAIGSGAGWVRVA